MYEFIEDPGHGWLKVPSAELDALNIRAAITRYSFERNGFAYLEEDCDLEKFVVAKAGSANVGDWFNANVTHRYVNSTPIRNYPRINA